MSGWRIQAVPQPDGQVPQWSERQQAWVPPASPDATTYGHPEDARDRLGALRCAHVSGAGGAQVVACGAP